ncbi:hypothetical protein [Paraburkholderia sp. RL18-085-BIA-A]|uniref:hypothetical protein n=1 Tax=Paraburkholderia sp. RL18-085-BIA-A TaxID=3031633 RepID=UPI0038BAF992
MSESMNSAASGDDETPWEERQAMELWKYFGSVGAADKNTMVTVEAFLQGFSATIIGYVVTKLVCFHPLGITEPYVGICLALLGFVIACVAGYVSLLYGGYSNWNWAKADAIARSQVSRDPRWKKLLPEHSIEAVDGTRRKASVFCAIAVRLGRPCDPVTQLAPIFSLYAWLALFTALFHLLVFLLSVCDLRR